MGIIESNYDFNKYKVFYVVAENRSFSKAAELLHISQPAISYAIKELETQLGCKLLMRNNKNVVLTEKGERLLHYVKKAFDNISLGEDSILEKNNDLAGIIRIGIYSHISKFMLPKVINKFLKKYPNAHFYIYSSSNSEMITMLRNRELDFIVLQYPIFINDYTFKEETLCELETCFFANKEYYDSYITKKKNITEYPLILPKRGYADIDILEEKLKKNNYVLKHNITSYTSELTTELVAQGLGIGWTLKECIKEQLEKHIFYEIPVSFNITTIFSIAYDDMFLNDTTVEFIDFFKKEIKKLSK